MVKIVMMLMNALNLVESMVIYVEIIQSVLIQMDHIIVNVYLDLREETHSIASVNLFYY